MSAYSTKIYSNGEWKLMSLELWESLEGPKPPPMFVDNGCSYSPDQLLITHDILWPACRIHDWHYSKATTIADSVWAAKVYHPAGLSRKEADKRFKRNILRCLKWQKVNWLRRHYWAWTYYRAVRRFGESAYEG